MKVKAQVGFKENVTLTVRDKKGRYVRRIKSSNLVVLTGRNLTRDILAGLMKCPSHIAIGSSNTAVVDSDVALGVEVYRDLITKRFYNSSLVGFQLFVPTTEANGNTIREAGIFYAPDDTAASGTLFARTVFADVVKTNAISITVTWTITITSS